MFPIIKNTQKCLAWSPEFEISFLMLGRTEGHSINNILIWTEHCMQATAKGGWWFTGSIIQQFIGLNDFEYVPW